MMSLVQYNKYSRKEVHDILSPETTFTPQAGTWGLQGIVRVPEKESDYVFFVTYGQSQGSHTFDEGIDEEGILSWQSQPRMGFRSPEISSFIDHNPDTGNIYLFLRTNSTDRYTYLGVLEYVGHEKQREFPVYFKWRIIGWDKEKAMSALQNLVIKPAKRAYPVISSSFTWLSDNVLVKELDKSAFLHRGTHIPLEVLKFWGKQLQVGENRSIVVYFHDTQYSMDLVREVHGRTRLFWKSDFVEIIHTQFPEAYEAFVSDTPVEDPPEIRFRKQDDDTYIIDLIDESKNEMAQQLDSPTENHLTFAEGRAYDYTGTRFERDPKNRKLAIQYHGLTCYGCGFNFGSVYGTHGEGFIEIHHLNPLYMNEAEVIVDPYTDLLPLCSNCHRMVHRSRIRTLSLDELKKLIRK